MRVLRAYKLDYSYTFSNTFSFLGFQNYDYFDLE